MDFFKCYGCLRTLPKTQFYVRQNKKNGIDGTCKQCTNENTKLHIEKINLWQHEGTYTHEQINRHNAAVETILRRAKCKDCGAAKPTISRLIKSNGTSDMIITCISCGRNSGPHKHSLFTKEGVIIELVAVHDDRRDQSKCCSVDGCYNVNVELHHWLPVHLAEDYNVAEAYPKSYLCKEHHDLWHKFMTPYHKKHAQEAQ